MRPSTSLLFVRLGQYRRAVILCLIVATLAAPLCSAQARGSVDLSPVVGFYFPTSLFQAGCLFEVDGGACLPHQKTAVATGGRVTAWVNERVAVEGSLLYSPSTVLDDLVAGGVRVQLGLLRSSGAWVYVEGGPGLVSHGRPGRERTASLGGLLGVGAHFRLLPWLAIRGDIEEYVSSFRGSSQRGATLQDLFVSMGLSVALRSTGRTRAEAPALPDQ